MTVLFSIDTHGRPGQHIPSFRSLAGSSGALPGHLCAHIRSRIALAHQRPDPIRGCGVRPPHRLPQGWYCRSACLQVKVFTSRLPARQESPRFDVGPTPTSNHHSFNYVIPALLIFDNSLAHGVERGTTMQLGWMTFVDSSVANLLAALPLFDTQS